MIKIINEEKVAPLVLLLNYFQSLIYIEIIIDH